MQSQRISSAKWWEETGDDGAQVLISTFRRIQEAQAWRTDADEYHAGMYAGGPAQAGVKGHQRSASVYYEPASLPYNVARGATDTLVAKIAKHRPLPEVLTNRQNWAQQKRARKMSDFLSGEFHKQRFFEKKAKVIVRDACIFGRGILHVYDEGKSICCERVHPWELFHDEWDSRYGDPRSIYRIRSVDRQVLIGRFGKSDATEGAGFIDKGYSMTNSDHWTTVDRVDVVEAWHLCDNEQAHKDDEKHKCNGAHYIATTAGLLHSEVWEHDGFPFASLYYSDPISGMYGQGLVEQLEGYQYEINIMAQKVSDSHHMLGGAWILCPTGSGVINTELTNGLGMVVNHKPGAPPQVYQPTPVHPQTYQRLRDLPQDALADVGISQMAAQSQKPAGITAGIALQTLDDIESERFIIFGRAYESFCLDVARLFISCIRNIAKREGEYAVRVQMRGGFLDLKWADVELDDYELKVFPTSLLPQQLGARLEKLTMLFNSGVIDRATFLRQLDAPDLQAELDLETADKIAIDERIEAMLESEEDEGEAAYKAPNPYQDLKWAARRAQQKMNKAETDGAPEFNMDLLRRFVGDCEDMIAIATPMQPELGAAPPMAA